MLWGHRGHLPDIKQFGLYLGKKKNRHRSLRYAVVTFFIVFMFRTVVLFGLSPVAFLGVSQIRLQEWCLFGGFPSQHSTFT